MLRRGFYDFEDKIKYNKGMEYTDYYNQDPHTQKEEGFYTSQLPHPAFRTNNQELWWQRFLKDHTTTLDFPDWIAQTITTTSQAQPDTRDWNDVDAWYKKYELSESLAPFITWIQNPTLR